MGDEDRSVPGSSWIMGSIHQNRDKPKERSASSLGDPKLCLRIRKFLIGFQENCKRELGDNSDTPCGNRSHRTIEDSIVATGIRESCDEKR